LDNLIDKSSGNVQESSGKVQEKLTTDIKL